MQKAEQLEVLDLDQLTDVTGGATYGQMCLQGAGVGATLGSFLGPKGAAAGAAIGCGIGLGIRAVEGPG